MVQHHLLSVIVDKHMFFSHFSDRNVPKIAESNQLTIVGHLYIV